VHRMTEDYVNVVGDLMYPKKTYDQFGYLPTSASGVVATSSSNGKVSGGAGSAGNASAPVSSTLAPGPGTAVSSSSGIPMLSRINTLGYLTNPLRRRSVLEMWSPYEVSVFEACMTLYGKNFHKIQKQVCIAPYSVQLCAFVMLMVYICLVLGSHQIDQGNHCVLLLLEENVSLQAVEKVVCS
jgi:hypothetical protein